MCVKRCKNEEINWSSVRKKKRFFSLLTSNVARPFNISSISNDRYVWDESELCIRSILLFVTNSYVSLFERSYVTFRSQ